MKNIVMIGPHGERDYVEGILQKGCPCICGHHQEFAFPFDDDVATKVAEKIRQKWLAPHVSVELEEALLPF